MGRPANRPTAATHRSTAGRRAAALGHSAAPHGERSDALASSSSVGNKADLAGSPPPAAGAASPSADGRYDATGGPGESRAAMNGPTDPAGKTMAVWHCPGPGLAGDMDQGMALYRAFNGLAPARIRKARHPRLMPPVVVALGDLVGLIYRSDKGQPGRPSTYIHFMEEPPLLVSNPTGSQLYLIGGSYRVTGRGIEG